jgi:hypothetical protein
MKRYKNVTPLMVRYRTKGIGHKKSEHLPALAGVLTYRTTCHQTKLVHCLFLLLWVLQWLWVTVLLFTFLIRPG